MSSAAPAPGSAAPVRILLFTRSLTQPALIDSLNASLKASRNIDYKVVTNGEELISCVVGGDRVVVIANCLLKEDIADLYNSLPLLNHRCEEGTLQVIVLNSIRHPRLAALLRERGVLEAIEMPLALDALQMKVKIAMDRLDASWKAMTGEAPPAAELPVLGTPGWNDLRGAESAPAVAKGAPRSALKPDGRFSREAGLREVQAPGLVAGEKSFERMQLTAEALQICGERLTPPQEIFIYDVTEHGATLIVPREVSSKGDRIQLTVRFDNGATRHACTMLWDLETFDLDMGAKRLATGRFRGGDYAGLSALVNQLNARKKELKDFFSSAKG